MFFNCFCWVRFESVNFFINIVISTNQGAPLVGNNTMAGKAYMNICKRVDGEEVPFLDLAGKGGLFSRLFKKN